MKKKTTKKYKAKKYKVWRPKELEVIDIDGKVLPPYEVILKISGLEYKSEGISIDDALANLGLSWEQIKAKGTICIKHGKDFTEHLFFPKQLRRIFANKITRMMWAKRLDLFLSEKWTKNI